MHFRVYVLVVARATSPSTIPGFLPPRLSTAAQRSDNDTPHKALTSEGGALTQMEEPVRLMVTQLQAGALSPAHPKVSTVSCLASHQRRGTLGVCWRLSAPLISLALEPVPRESRVCMFFDSQRAADVCLGSIQARTNVRLVFVSICFDRCTYVSPSLCVTSKATEVLWRLNVQITQRHSGPLDSPSTTTLSNAVRACGLRLQLS